MTAKKHQSKRGGGGSSKKSGGFGVSFSSAGAGIGESDHDGHHSPHAPRRGGSRWSASMKSVANQLHVSHNEPRNLKTCMKVATLEDSLRSCDDKKKKRKSKKVETRRSVIMAQFNKDMASMANLINPRNLVGRDRSNGGVPGGRRLVKALSKRDDGSSGGGGGGGGDTSSSGKGRSLQNLGGLTRLMSDRTSKSDTEEVAQDTPPLPTTGTADEGPDKNDDTRSCMHKGVSFDSLSFREYKVLAGDNPGVSKGGPALELGWEHTDSEPLNVDEYESTREPRMKLREMKLSRKERERRLLESGCTQREINKSMKKVNMARSERKKTLENMAGARTEEKREAMIYRMKRFLGMERSDSAKDDALWDDANNETLAVVGRPQQEEEDIGLY